MTEDTRARAEGLRDWARGMTTLGPPRPKQSPVSDDGDRHLCLNGDHAGCNAEGCACLCHAVQELETFIEEQQHRPPLVASTPSPADPAQPAGRQIETGGPTHTSAAGGGACRSFRQAADPTVCGRATLQTHGQASRSSGCERVGDTGQGRPASARRDGRIWYIRERDDFPAPGQGPTQGCRGSSPDPSRGKPR